MKLLRSLVTCCFLALAGCTAATDQHYAKLQGEAPERATTGQFEPLTPVELDHVKAKIDHLQPYMTLNDCTRSLGIQGRNVPRSVWGPPDSRSMSMELRVRHILLLVCDNHGYVVSAQLDEKKWAWPH